MEVKADYIGLLLIASASYDPRVVPILTLVLHVPTFAMFFKSIIEFKKKKNNRINAWLVELRRLPKTLHQPVRALVLLRIYRQMHRVDQVVLKR